MKPIRILAAGWALAITAGWTVPVHAQAAQAGPSFSCASAGTKVEKTICATPALAAADREMAALFTLARPSAFGTGQSNELEAQRTALKSMRDCEKSPPSRPIAQCLAAAYEARNSELATAVLLRAPDTALPILRRLDIGFAPVLEATALWAGEPVNAQWSAPARAAKKKRITALLMPYFTKLQTDEDQSFGWSILSGPGGSSPIVKQFDDIFLSDRHYAMFLNVLGPYLPDPGGKSGGVIQRALPCAAIVRHPALIGATNAVFGSTMDSFVLRDDCERTLPPTPALTALDRKISDTWPECDGTIRFAAYRSYDNTVDAARLGQTTRPADRKQAIPKGVPAAMVNAARTELAGYYAGNLGKSPAVAGTMAQDAIAAILSDAHSCGT